MVKYSNKAKIFFDDIFGNNPYDAYVLFYAKSKQWNTKTGKYDSVMSKTWYCKTSEVSNYISYLDINPTQDYYFTLNSFKNSKGKDNIPTNRKDSLFAFNGIVIDIDCHYKDRIIEKDFTDVIRLIDLYTVNHHLPWYSYIIKTGRGLHIYYLHIPCSSKLNFLVDMAKEYLLEHYKKIIEPMPQFLIDAGASKRYSGIYRMPYTINQATKTEATIQYWGIPSKLDINVFLEKILKGSEAIKKKKTTIPIPDIITGSNDPNPPNIQRCTKVLREVEKYQNNTINKNTGHENRNRTSLVYAAFLLNIYPQGQALQLIKEFNNRYKVPLSEERLISIISYLTKNHSDSSKLPIRYFTNAKILELLEIESGEYDIIVTENYKYNSFFIHEDDEERKNRKKEKVKKRKQTIQLIKKGYKYTDISEKTGLSISTISRIQKSENIPVSKIKDERPWEALGISRATYYRKNE